MTFARRFADALTETPWIWFFISALALLLLTRNLPWRLDDYDQAKQAFVSYEMLHAGQWWFQHTPDHHVATKPPLIGWFSAALRMAGLPWDLAWRLPGMLAALVIGIVLYREAARLWPRCGGALAIAAFGLNMLAIRLTTLVRTDMALTLWIFLLGWVMYRQIRDGGAWRTWRGGLAVAALALAADFTKGPIFYAFLLPGAAAMAFLGARHQLFERPWRWFAGFVLWSLVGLILFLDWALLGALANPAFYEEVVINEFLGRFTTGREAVHNNQPFYFYLLHLLHKFAPWSIALLVLPWFGRVRGALRSRPEILWLACWALGGLLVMSLIPSKRVDRIFPVIPPLALLLPFMVRALAASVAEKMEAPARSGTWAGVLLILAILAWGGYGVQQVVVQHERQEDQLVKFGREARRLADLRGARLGIVKAYDEGLLLYAGALGFLERDEAVELWNRGKITGLILDRKSAEKLQAQLRAVDQPVFSLRETQGKRKLRYVLVFRRMDADAPPPAEPALPGT